MALGGLSLALRRSPDDQTWAPLRFTPFAGWLLVAISVGYVVLTRIRREPLRLFGLELPLPPTWLAATQLVVSCVDWALAGAVLYALLPPTAAGVFTVLAAFLAAQLLGLASHVPGGVGVFEGLMVLLLKPYLASDELLPALVVYRAIYYLLPLSVALLVLVGDTLRRHRSHTATGHGVAGPCLRAGDAAAARDLRVHRRASCCCSPVRRRPRKADWPGSIGSCRSASSRRRTSWAVSPACCCCCCRRDCPGASMPRTT